MTGVSTRRDGTRYMFSVYAGDDSIITVTRGDKSKTVNVGYEGGMTYQLTPSKINCGNGAHGLFKWLSECFVEHFMECLAYKLLDYAIDKMKVS